MMTLKLQAKPAKKTSSSMRAEFSDKLNPLDDRTWSRFFPEHPDSAEMIGLMGDCGMDEFEFSSIVVKDNDGPLLLLPLFTTHYDLTTTLSGSALQLAGAAKALLPKLVRPKVLGVGFVEGEWGEVGFDRNASLESLEKAWVMAIEALNRRAKALQAQLIAFKDFTYESGKNLPVNKLGSFSCVNSMPYCQMELRFASIEDYLKTLDPDLRRYLKRAEKKRQDLRITYENQVGPWIDQVYDLYLTQVQQSESSFGIHRRQYFERVCDTVPGARYVLYYLADKLIGFELLVEREDSLIQKYIGMDRETGRDYKLFFLSWLENIRYCLERGITHTHIGASQEKLKSELGASLVPSVVLTRHVDPIMNRLLKFALPELEYVPKVPVTRPALGYMWT
jgi:hypothetical protein